ncbi:hypothetical protein E2C01_092975 [Portunus trituberculatus]|uniref:Uncharacterized protein n=1 Tax=Portunus trituberculatus TaxID=210409 RepID=A0A5B7JHV9_PORTR|nr:hypothetical protein [Portunus trituberculatus]
MRSKAPGGDSCGRAISDRWPHQGQNVQFGPLCTAETTDSLSGPRTQLVSYYRKDRESYESRVRECAAGCPLQSLR